jgi:hypothetical protein
MALAILLGGFFLWNEARASAASATNAWRLRELTRAVQMYVGDWAVIPTVTTPRLLKAELSVPTYVSAIADFHDVAGRPFAGSPALSGRRMRSLPGSRQVLFYESAPGPNGSRLVAFTDGSVRRVKREPWASLRRTCGAP